MTFWLLYLVFKKLRYNSHTIKFTLLKCTIRWFLVNSQSCATITTIQLQSISSPEKETLCPWAVTHQPPGPSPWQELIYFLSLWICLFWKVLCYWLLLPSIMFTSFTHIIALSPMYLHSLLWLYNIPIYGQTTVCLSINWLMDIWVVSIWGAYEYASMNICVHVFV